MKASVQSLADRELRPSFFDRSIGVDAAVQGLVGEVTAVYVLEADDGLKLIFLAQQLNSSFIKKVQVYPHRCGGNIDQDPAEARVPQSVLDVTSVRRDSKAPGYKVIVGVSNDCSLA